MKNKNQFSSSIYIFQLCFHFIWIRIRPDREKNNKRPFLEKYIFNGFTCLKMWYAQMLHFGRWPRRIRTAQVQIEKLFLLRKLKRIKVKHINRRINKTYENNIWVVSFSFSFHLYVYVLCMRSRKLNTASCSIINETTFAIIDTNHTWLVTVEKGHLWRWLLCGIKDEVYGFSHTDCGVQHTSQVASAFLISVQLIGDLKHSINC